MCIRDRDYPDFAKVDVNNVYTYTDDDGKLNFVSTTDLKKAVEGKSDLPTYSIAENVPAYVGNNEVLPYDATDKDMKAAYEQICKDFPAEKISSSDNIYTWTSGGKTYFATLEDLQTTAQSAPDPSKPTEKMCIRDRLTGLLTLLQNNYTMQVLILHLLMQVRLWKNVLDLWQKIWAQKLL